MSEHIICIIRTIVVGWRFGLWFLVEKRDELLATVPEILWGEGGAKGLLS
jgi:hypothetical protein